MSINSLIHPIFPSGNNKYRKLEQENLQKLQTLLMPNGINISHKTEASNKIIQKWISDRNVNSSFKKIFKQTALMGNCLVIWLKNKEDHQMDIYINNLFGLSNVKLVNLTPMKASLRVQTGNNDGKSPYMQIDIEKVKDKKDTFQMKITLINYTEKEASDLEKQMGISFMNNTNISEISSKEIPIHYFTFLPQEPVFTGILSAVPFNANVKGSGNENDDVKGGLQQVYNQTYNVLFSEVNTVFSTRTTDGLTAQELKDPLRRNKSFSTRFAKLGNKLSGVVGNVESSLEEANPAFNQIKVLDYIAKEYEKGCYLDFSTDKSNVSESSTQASIHLTKTYIEDLRLHWDNQFFNMSRKIISMMDIKVEENNEYLISCNIRKNIIGESMKLSEEAMYDVKNNLSNIIEEVATRYNVDENTAKLILDQNININEEYKDDIYSQEQMIAEISGKLQEAQNHPEDIADKDNLSKKDNKDIVDKESV